MVKKLQLPEEALSKFSKLESSIAHWSYEHTVLLLRARKLIENIDSLFLARQKIVDEFLGENGISTRDVDNVNVSPTGEAIISLKEPVPAVDSPGAPSNSTQ